MQKGFIPVVLAVIFGLIIGGAVAAAYFLGRNSADQQISLPQTSQVVTSQSDNQVQEVIDTVPRPNALYLGKYQNQEAVFVTNLELGKHYQQGVESFSEYKGSLSSLSGIGYSPFEYKNLQSPKRILTLPHDLLQINNFKLSDDQKYIYLSLMLKTKTANPYPDNTTNHIYRVNLSSLEFGELWVHDMSLNKYKNAGGPTVINKISSDYNYLVLSIFDCFACEGSEAGLIILNTQTKAEKYLEMIGNVQFHISSKVFTYQNLAAFKELCEPGLGCDDNNQRTVYKPAGETLSATLP